MQGTTLSMRWLEVFRLVARSGSIRKVASDTGLSISTVSQHLRSLEDKLGVHLLDHSRRPMVLTPSGTIFLRYVDEGLSLIHRGEIELTSGNLIESRTLRLGVVDDFENDVTPELVLSLARTMPKCTFLHHTRPSHEILGLLFEQKIDVAIATRPLNDVPGLIEYPILRDPFLLAVSSSNTMSGEDLLAGRSNLPFLRYSRHQIIGNLIEAHLRRIRVTLPNRFELESNQSILSMVAEGSGWAITTPASFARVKRLHDRITLLPFPAKSFSRTLSLFTKEVYPQSIAEMIAQSMRHLISRHVIEPVTSETPWLAPDFLLLSDQVGPKKGI